MAKSRSGAFIPNGYTTRGQVDGASPWAIQHGKHLMKVIDAEKARGSEPCPDCVQEMHIRERELRQNKDNERNQPKCLQAMNDQKHARMSSVPELLDMIDQAATEIQVNSGKIAEHYANQRNGSMRDKYPVLSGSDFGEVIHNGQFPAHGPVDQQNIDQQYRNLYSMLSAPPPQTPLVHTATPTPVSTPVLGKPQTPQLEHPTIDHAPKLADAAKELSSKPTAPSITKASEQTHHSVFNNLLHPFQTTAAKQPTPTLPHPSATPAPAAPSALPTTPSLPLRIDSPLALVTQPIAASPNPYHHAPPTPLDANVAAYIDPAVQKQQQAFRAAMKTDREKVGQGVQAVSSAAAAAEREARRASLPARAKGLASKAGPVEKKVWLGSA